MINDVATTRTDSNGTLCITKQFRRREISNDCCNDNAAIVSRETNEISMNHN